MEIVEKIDVELQGKYPILQQQQSQNDSSAPSSGVLTSPGRQSQQQQQQQQQKTKRKHRRGKPKAKNANKPYKKTNWNFQVPRFNYNNKGNGGGGGGGGINGGNNNRNSSRVKLARSRSLVPYNTNKFLMEEHMADVPSALLTPSGRTRDSSFSVDSEDNYFFSLPEDEEEFLTKEFANVYEKARVERLENLTKQQLIEECLQIEDRYSTDQGTQHEQQLTVQRISAEFLAKIRMLEEKVKELSRENYNLRCQLMRSAALAAAASPPSAAAPTGAACEPIPMDSSSEDSESDSSSSSTSTSSSSSGAAVINDDHVSVNGDSADGNDDCNLSKPAQRRHSCSSRSSLSEYNAYIENNYIGNDVAGIDEEDDNDACRAESDNVGAGDGSGDSENQNLLESRMEDDSNASTGEVLNQYVAAAQQQKQTEMLDSVVSDDSSMIVTNTPMLASNNTSTVNTTDTVNESAPTGPICYK